MPTHRKKIILVPIISSILFLNGCMSHQTEQTVVTKMVTPQYSTYNEMNSPIIAETNTQQNNFITEVTNIETISDNIETTLEPEEKIIYVYPDDPKPKSFSIEEERTNSLTYN